MLRLSWSQPEDLLPHALRSAELEGSAVAAIAARWAAAGGSIDPAVSGASPQPATAELRALARALLDEVDQVPAPRDLLEREPEDFPGISALTAPGRALPPPDAALADRIHGAWLGRAIGCLLGKPVEKISREGIRAIAQSTGNWPVSAYFTGRGLDPEIAARHPWNRRSRSTSLLENIAGMPEDDDLNFPLIALGLLEEAGPDFSTETVASSWLANLPGGRVFTAERVTYRNLLDGIEPEEAGQVRNPFRDWIGAQIRADLYGWVSPGRPGRAAELAWRDGRLSHGRSGLYGAMFVAAACSAALVADTVDDVIEAGLAVIPAGSRYADAIRFGRELARHGRPDEVALDALDDRYGHLHWVHALNNSALLAFAVTRSEGEFERAITLAVTGGWDTDSVGATAGSLTGALCGRAGLPEHWTAPLRNRLASSVPGFDGVAFDVLAARTLALAETGR